MESLKGSLLIASPGLSDPNFARTVIFIAEHNEEGAFGLVLNRPGKVKVADLWASISSDPCNSEAPAFSGGPVEEDSVVFLHACLDLQPDGDPVVPGVLLGREIELLEKVLRKLEQSTDDLVGRVRVFCGYSGWGPGQLDEEMKAGGWLTLPACAEHVFAVPPEKLWSSTLETFGGVYRFFALLPPNPELN